MTGGVVRKGRCRSGMRSIPKEGPRDVYAARPFVNNRAAYTSCGPSSTAKAAVRYAVNARQYGTTQPKRQ